MFMEIYRSFNIPYKCNLLWNIWKTNKFEKPLFHVAKTLNVEALGLTYEMGNPSSTQKTYTNS